MISKSRTDVIHGGQVHLPKTPAYYTMPTASRRLDAQCRWMDQREGRDAILAILASYTRVILCRQNTCVLGDLIISRAVKDDSRHEV